MRIGKTVHKLLKLFAIEYCWLSIDYILCRVDTEDNVYSIATLELNTADWVLTIADVELILKIMFTVSQQLNTPDWVLTISYVELIIADKVEYPWLSIDYRLCRFDTEDKVYSIATVEYRWSSIGYLLCRFDTEDIVYSIATAELNTADRVLTIADVELILNVYSIATVELNTPDWVLTIASLM